jgi:tRNA/tmRNA/rRNA uracil-C5-methylase (TrmA/RlmC/RlmD family)
LYAGSGAFSFALAAAAQRVSREAEKEIYTHTTSVEGIGECQATALKNVAVFSEWYNQNSVKPKLPTERSTHSFEIVGSDVETFCTQKTDKLPLPNVVICDPPRDGLGLKLSNFLAEFLLHQAKIQNSQISLVMVFCDSASFARDISVFLTQGFTLQRAEMFDAFPQTTHMEILCWLKVSP